MFGEDFLKKRFNGEPLPVVLSRIVSAVTSRRFSFLYILLGNRLFQWLSPSYRRFLEYQNEFTQNFLMKYIQEKFEEFKIRMKENPNLEDKYLIESMFRLVLKEEENFTLEEVLSNSYILFVAGTDTTGHLLGHIIYLLWKNPKKYEKLMEELNQSLTIIDKMDYDSFKSLEYLNGVIKEALSMVTPANDVLLRVAIQDHKLGDLFIKKGTCLYLGLTINSHDPKIFRKPFEFVPERWIKGHELFDNAEEKDPYCYLPFSAGARNCIGQHMAKEPITWVHRFVTEPKDPLIAKLTRKIKK